jgi:epoxyqueuosine reductase QueG
LDSDGDNFEKLHRFAASFGIDLFGVGDVRDKLDTAEDLPTEIVDGLNFGISLGVRLSDSVIDGISTGPTRIYLHHYRQVNYLLDRASLRLGSFIQNMGYRSLAIPASQIVDWNRQVGHFSHKMAAVRSGLAWIGRNNLAVSPDYGSRVRYATVLTDMPIETGGPLELGCGSCRDCIETCPANAIRETFSSYDMNSCLEKLRWFSKSLNIGQYICGICVKACKGPKGEKL